MNEIICPKCKSKKITPKHAPLDKNHIAHLTMYECDDCKYLFDNYELANKK